MNGFMYALQRSQRTGPPVMDTSSTGAYTTTEARHENRRATSGPTRDIRTDARHHDRRATPRPKRDTRTDA